MFLVKEVAKMTFQCKSKLHLPWHQHLFYADFIREVMSKQYFVCVKKRKTRPRGAAVIRYAADLPAPIHTPTSSSTAMRLDRVAATQVAVLRAP